ncbi:MAG: hypothetical protein ACJ8ER_02620 [Allosphingosinicella sp.]
MWDEVERFAAIGDSGRTYTVVIYQKLIEFRPLSGPVQYAKGAMDAKLLDGRDVNPKDTETFEIVETGEIIRKVEQ